MKATYLFDSTIEAIIERFRAQNHEHVVLEDRGMCQVVHGPNFRIEKCLGFFGTHLTIPRWHLRVSPDWSMVLHRYAGTRKQWAQDADWWFGQYDFKFYLKSRRRPRLLHQYRDSDYLDRHGRDTKATGPGGEGRCTGPARYFLMDDDGGSQYLPRCQRPWERRYFPANEMLTRFDNWLTSNVLEREGFEPRGFPPEHTWRHDWQVATRRVKGTILTDISDTLVRVERLDREPSSASKTCSNQAAIERIDGELYRITLRPSARIFLAMARKMAPVYALTRLDSAFQSRVLAVVGLEVDGVFGRDNYQRLALPNQNWVLVDDLRKGSAALADKLRWLGVAANDLRAAAASRCVRCIEFRGLYDPLPLWHIIPTIEEILEGRPLSDRLMMERS